MARGLHTRRQVRQYRGGGKHVRPASWWLRIGKTAAATLVAIGIAAVSQSVDVRAARATTDPNATFSFLADGFTQDVWAVSETFPVGIAFGNNGDVFTCYGGGHRFSAASSTQVHGSTVHTETLLSGSGCNGLGVTNNPDGYIFNNGYDGVRKLDPNNGLALVAGPYGAPGAYTGITTDPQTGNLVYVASDYTIHWVNTSFTATGTFSTNSLGHGLIDQIAFDPTGNFLFLAGWGDNTLIVLNRNGTVVQVIPMTHQPDGISFHSTAPLFVAVNDTDGTLDRFDFANNNYTAPPTQTLLGSGAGYGDHTGVGPDGCWYVSNNDVKYADGTFAGFGIVRICPGFQPPPGVGGGGQSLQNSSWAGYLNDGASDPYSTVIGTQVTVPQVTCNTKGDAVFWLGWDGFSSSSPNLGNSNDVIQDGLGVHCDAAGTHAKPSYFLWYELFKGCQLQSLGSCGTPTFNTSWVKIGAKYSLVPGDKVDLNIAIEAGPRFVLHLPDSVLFTIEWTDASGHKLGSWSKVEREPAFYAPTYSETECIAEWPSGRAAPLPNFGTVTFTNCGPIDSAPAGKLYQLNVAGGPTGIVTSGVQRNSVGENSFTDTWFGTA